MEDVLNLYAEAYDPQYPVVCFDESPYQLIRETRIPLPVEPGKPARYDYEYKREGTCNLFMFSSHWRAGDMSRSRNGGQRKTTHSA